MRSIIISFILGYLSARFMRSLYVQYKARYEQIRQSAKRRAERKYRAMLKKEL